MDKKHFLKNYFFRLGQLVMTCYRVVKVLSSLLCVANYNNNSRGIMVRFRPVCAMKIATSSKDYYCLLVAKKEK